MEQVFQQDDEGCWIACVSMLTGVSYKEIKGRFQFQDDVTGRSAGPIVQLLNELGYECESKSTTLKKAKALRKLRANALVYMKNIGPDGCERGGHWTVWDKDEGVLRDPDGFGSTRRRVLKSFRLVTKRSGQSK